VATLKFPLGRCPAAAAAAAAAAATALQTYYCNAQVFQNHARYAL